MAPKTKGSIEALKALARSMYFSNESCEWFAQEASAGQIQIACRLIEVEQEVRAKRIWRSLSAGRPWRPADACGSSRRRGWSCS